MRAGLGRINRLIRDRWWQEGRRRGPPEPYQALREYLWRQSSWLDSLPRMVGAVQTHARRQPEVTLFGDYATVPLLALEAGVRVTGDFFDTTGQRFRSGFATFEQVRRLLEGAPAALVLLRTGASGINRLPAMREYLATAYQPVEVFRSRAGVEHVLYRRATDFGTRRGRGASLGWLKEGEGSCKRDQYCQVSSSWRFRSPEPFSG